MKVSPLVMDIPWFLTFWFHLRFMKIPHTIMPMIMTTSTTGIRMMMGLKLSVPPCSSPGSVPLPSTGHSQVSAEARQRPSVFRSVTCVINVCCCSVVLIVLTLNLIIKCLFSVLPPPSPFVAFIHEIMVSIIWLYFYKNFQKHSFFSCQSDFFIFLM